MNPYPDTNDPSLRPEVFLMTLVIMGIVLAVGWGLWEIIKAVLS